MPKLTLLDVAKMNGSDSAVGLIEESLHASPEVRVGDARSIKGTTYKTLIRKSVPNGGFRNANEGKDPCRSTYDDKIVQTYIADCSGEMDAAVAEAHEDGVAALLAQEQAGNLEGQIRALGSQFYYGTANTLATSTADGASKGFAGLVQSVAASNVVDATGTTGGSATSVWMVKFGTRHLQWVVGQGGAIDERDPYLTRLTDGNNKPFDGWRAPLLFWIGLQVVNPNSFVQLKNVTAESGKGVDDDKLSDMLHTFAAGIVPDAIFMTRRSRGQLQKSRAALNTIGMREVPVEYEGIPIITTDNILNTEAVV